ncbi:2Fe-2S iron-sulfur cluster-binding protein [Halioxenophilus sp. WMMB6]|uniref:2Fe-2S iron-sulfur cluster-binding protein n=1 Tax=Halioxenophilus sp. WMMB6 TaxID=3073815 RepID=UPI00295EB533|nr:2Fe-2S iron-sulfur cluster-binding protein [Halioxenophilus sp. WMMB6]
MEKHTIYIVDIDSGAHEAFCCRSDESILSALYRLGRKGIPSGCRGGGCGICKVQIISGVYRRKPMSSCHICDDDIDSECLLACRVFPDSDIRLQVVGKMKFKFGGLEAAMGLQDHSSAGKATVRLS